MEKQKVEPTWLRQLIGEWTYSFSAGESSGHPGETAEGTESIRAIGDTWIVAENKGNGSDGSTSHSVMTLGYEPSKARFTGAIAGTMAPVLFIFEGCLGEDSKSLLLETEGPAITEGRATDKYRDVIRLLDENTRELIAEVLDGKGQWREFMRTRYQRMK
jgi:hypothetical protein